VGVEPVAKRRSIHFAGRVQGVGFRFTTRAIAKRYPVVGFVQNLADGRVRIVVEGAPEALGAFVADVAAEMDRHIDSTDVCEQPATGEFLEFEVRR
jgi:acylphosphatase